MRFVAVWRRDLVMLPSGGPMSESSENKNLGFQEMEDNVLLM